MPSTVKVNGEVVVTYKKQDHPNFGLVRPWADEMKAKAFTGTGTGFGTGR